MTPVLADGAPAYVVSLSGGRGRREAMLIDRDDWAWVSKEVTPVWVVNWSGGGNTYVCSGSRAAASAAGATGDRPRVNLHALLYALDQKIEADQLVVFINGDRRDLRRCNLMAIDRSELRGHVETGFRADVSYLENAEDGEDPGSSLP